MNTIRPLLVIWFILANNSIFAQNTLIVTDEGSGDDGICDSHCTLSEAISEAASGDTILFQGVVNISIKSPHLEIDKNLVIIGPGTDSLTIARSVVPVGNRLFYIKQGVQVHMEELSLEGGEGFQSGSSNLTGGGAIYNEGEIFAKNINFRQNNSSTIYNIGNASLTNCFILNGDSGPTEGNGIHNLGELYMNKCTITNNEGSGVNHSGTGTATLIDCMINNNKLGGIIATANLIIDSCAINNNIGTVEGGGIRFDSAVAIIANSVINNNITDKFGGGIYNGKLGSISIFKSTISDNEVAVPSPSIGNPTGTHGGGGLFSRGILNLESCTISNNRIPSQRAIVSGVTNIDGDITLINCTISQTNTGFPSNQLALLIFSSAQPVTGQITNCTFYAIRAISAPLHTQIRSSLIIGSITNLTSQGYNIFQDTANSNMVFDSTDIIGPEVVSIANFLSPLQENGGNVFTYALLKDSLGHNPAIDKINLSGTGTPVTDQRGLPRFGLADIGAFEYHKVDVAAPIKVLCIGQDFSLMDDITISDSLGGGLQVGENLTFILEMPDRFSLNPGVGTVESIGQGINILNHSISDTTITINYDRIFESGLNQIMIKGLEVKASIVSTGADIIRLGGTALQRENEVSDSVSHGRLIASGSVPIAGFSWKNDCLGDSIEFQDESIISDGFLAYWNWDFDFGNTSSAQNPFYAYGDSGIYEVSLIVGPDSNCTDTILQHVPVFPSILPLAADPYFEDFETGPAGWLAGGENKSWQWGIANGTKIADPGNHAWSTNLDSTYNSNENSWVIGPCLDLRNLDRPMLKMKVWTDTEENFDGAVMQASADGGASWENIGSFNGSISSGLNWYNEIVTAGSPTFGSGWTGQRDSTWKVARHRLDKYGSIKNLKLRIVFASDGNQPIGRALDGFAFDDIWVGNRQKEVLAEHFTNTSSTGMPTANDTIYKYALANSLDLIPVQYHTNFSGPDNFYAFNPSVSDTRSFYYKINEPNQVVIAGQDYNENSTSLSQNVLDLSMLKDPIFDIDIEPIFFFSPNSLRIRTSIKALNNLDEQDVIVQIAILQKEAQDGNGNTLKHIVRDMLPNAGGTLFQRDWQLNDTEMLEQSWTIPAGFTAEDLTIVVFIQNYVTGEIYQASQRSVIEILTGITENGPGHDFFVYPNPARSDVHISFRAPLIEHCEWELIDMKGIPVAAGTIKRGTKHHVISIQKASEGIYSLKLILDHNKSLIRKLIIL